MRPAASQPFTLVASSTAVAAFALLAVAATANANSFSRLALTPDTLDPGDIDSVLDSPRFPRATDAKAIPGIACQRYSTGQSPAALELKYLGYALTAGGDDSTVVTCPIVRDNTDNLDGLSHVEVEIYNPTRGIEFECEVRSYGQYGAFVTAGSDSTTRAGNHTLDIDVVASDDPGYYVLNCTMPPVGTYTSKIFVYRYWEFKSTDDSN